MYQSMSHQYHFLSSRPEIAPFPNLARQTMQGVANRKPRMEEPLPTTTDEKLGTRKTASPAIAIGLLPPPPAADNDPANANTTADHVTDMIHNRMLGLAFTLTDSSSLDMRRRCQADSLVQLQIPPSRSGAKRVQIRTDWSAIAALLPGRPKSQCQSRRHHVLNPSIDRRANDRTDRWSEVQAEGCSANAR
jgi:hypothetical protein